MLNKSTIDSNLLVDCANAGSPNCNDDVESSSLALPDEADVGNGSNDDSHVCSVDTADKDTFMQNFASFFLKLQCRCNVPASTVELIASEMYNLHQQNADIFL